MISSLAQYLCQGGHVFISIWLFVCLLVTSIMQNNSADFAELGGKAMEETDFVINPDHNTLSLGLGGGTRVVFARVYGGMFWSLNFDVWH